MTVLMEPATGHSGELVACGWDEVFILDLSHQENGCPKKVWSWYAKQQPDLPEYMKDKFGSTDECKPVDGGRKILITSSGSGVALVDRKTSKTLFYAIAENAHSADMLPGQVLAGIGTGIGDSHLFPVGTVTYFPWGQSPVLGTVTYFPGRYWGRRYWGQSPISRWLWYSAGMPRLARIVVPEVRHHIIRRGDRRVR